jgi:hypothetical protein
MQGCERKAAYFTLRFDAETERSVIDLWIDLAEEGIELVGLSGHRPHITASAYETEDVVTFCARRWQPIQGWIEGIGILVPPDTTDLYDVSFARKAALNEAWGSL